MAHFKTDSELMTNLVPASAVPAGHKFVTVLDENDQVIVISLSNDRAPKLQAIRHSIDGVQYLFNLAACFSVPTDAFIQAFNVVQDTDRMLYLSFAYLRDDKSSHVILSQPFSPKDLHEGTKLQKVPGDPVVGTVHSIHMSSMSTEAQSSSKYPVVLLAHKNIDQTSSWGDDISQVMATEWLDGWSVRNTFSPPTNLNRILGIAPATNFHGQGFFVLYKTSAEESKCYGMFVKPDDQSSDGKLMSFATEVPCAKDATSIATICDDRGASALLIGSSEGLGFLNSREAMRMTQQPHLISSDSKIHGCNALRVVQDENVLAIWFTSSNEELGYIRTTMSVVESRSIPAPVLLLPSGKASSFAPLITRPTANNSHNVWQMLVSNDKYGNLTLLEQASDLGLWRTRPFYYNDEENNYEVQSYSMTIKAFNADGSPVTDASVRVASASAVTGILNGRDVTLTYGGNWYQADSEGVLNFIIPTKTIGTQILTITGLKNSEGEMIREDRVVFDPSKKSMDRLGEKLASFKSVDDLKKAKTQNGAPLFDADNMPSNEDLKNGLASLKELHSAYARLPSDGSSGADTPAAAPTAGTLEPVAGSTDFLEDVGDMFMDAWNWVKQAVKDAKDWVVETSGKVWKFVCRIAGKVYQFVLDTVEKIGEALTWVWEKIKIGFKKFIEYLGFLFNWGDILKTKNQVSALMTAGCGLAANKIGGAKPVVDKFFDGILAKIDHIQVPKDVTVSPKSGSGKAHSDQVEDAQHSTVVNWTGERMKNGGMGSCKAVQENNPPDEQAQKAWDEVFTPALNEIQEAFSNVGTQIKDIWIKTGSISTAELMKVAKSLLCAAVVTIKKLVGALLEALQKLIQIVSDIGNQTIKIPIFSALYKMIAKHDLTIFDAIALIVAIPATIFTKLITGSAPPEIPNLDAKLLEGILSDSKDVTEQTKLDFNNFTTGLTVSVCLVKTVYNLIKFAIALAKEGTSGALETLTGSKFIEFMSVALDMFTTLNSFPSDASLPGLECRKWISYITLLRGGSHILASFVPDKKGGEIKDRLLLVLDLATTLVTFGLYQAVGDAELKAAETWKDYNLDSTIMGIEGSVLNAVSGVGYFIAFMFKEQAHISGGGLVALEAATVALAAVEGINWKIYYDRKAKCLLTPSTS